MHKQIGTAIMLIAATALAPSSASAQPTTATFLARTAADASLQWGPCPPILPAGCQIAVLHGDPAQPNADIFLRVPAGYVIPAHRHTSPERMILVTGQLRVKYQGAAEATLTPGSYAYGPAGLPHRATCEGEAACTLFIAFEGPVDAEAVAGVVE